MSKEILAIIKKYKLLYLFTFFLGILITLYLYSTKSIQYISTGYFKYIPPNGITKTTKIDKNGTVTYESFDPGEGGLDFTPLANNKNLTVEFNTSKGIYVVKCNTISSNLSTAEVNNFLNLVVTKNSDFLKEKLIYAHSLEDKLKLENLIEYPQKSFPQIIRAEKVDIIDDRYIIIFIGVILSFFLSITVTILKKRVDEI